MNDDLQVSNKFVMNMKVVHIVLKNIFAFGIISIWPTHKKLGLSAFQNSQMNWLINFSSPWLISWWIDDWGHSNKFKYAWNDELKNFPWLHLTMGWGCFMSKAQLMNRWIRISLGNKPQTLSCFDQNDELRYLGGIFDGWDLWEPLQCLLSSSLGHIFAPVIS